MRIKKILFVNDCGNTLFEMEVEKNTLIPRADDEINLPNSQSYQKVKRVIFDYKRKSVVVLIGLMVA